MSDARGCLSRMPAIPRDRSDSQQYNAPEEEPNSRRPPADGRTRLATGAGGSLRTWFFFAECNRICGCSATPSWRRVRSRRAHRMHTTAADRSNSIEDPTKRRLSNRVYATGWKGYSHLTGSEPFTWKSTRNSETPPRCRCGTAYFHPSTHFGGVSGGCRKPDTPPHPSRTRVSKEVSNV